MENLDNELGDILLMLTDLLANNFKYIMRKKDFPDYIN